ncbi:serine/threonine protein phosphatase [Pseudomonas protegens]|uniref:metallophosphoesterase n=1 Tax=Pseudomonas protegens TaxID=380021 RepID=UPI001012B67D|nr:metallophosphoesterase [Pseudomonas protegens]RXU69785.1 serine/threonine protein phosphatase [Pseudomonas protegens]
MKVRIYSDLHREFHLWYPPDCSGVDLVILAGGIDKKTRGDQWANEAFECAVAYILGNHELYGGHLDRTLQRMRDVAEPHVHVLENEVLELASVRVLGTTSWTDFTSTGDQVAASSMAKEWMNDFKQIRTDSNYRRIRPDDLVVRNQLAKAWLTEQLSQNYAGKTVVVTHHSPSSLVAGNQNEGHLNASYSNEWPWLIEKSDLWVFGHTHHRVDMELSGCRLISNPRGYPDEHTGFDPFFEIEI